MVQKCNNAAREPAEDIFRAMPISRLLLVGTAMLLGSAACAGHRATPAVGEILTAAGSDTLRIASSAYDRCRHVEPATRVSCYSEILSTLAGRGQVKLAMRSLERLGDRSPEVRRDGHIYAHGIGIAAGQSDQPTLEAFTSCSEAFQSGCYHGVIQAHFAKLSTVGPREVDGLCAPFTGDSNRWLRFQCVHGIGHGLTMLNAHHLPKALAGCDMLSDAWDRSSCYGGAFMENIVNATAPHHPAHKLAGNAPGTHDHPSHDHAADPDGDSPTAKYKALEPADPHYPCSSMAQKYLFACYQMQTSVILYLNRGDIKATSGTCESAPRGLKAVCFQSLGRDISSRTLQGHAESIRLCTIAPQQYQPWCFTGLVKNFIDITSRESDGHDFCAKVPGTANRSFCYFAVGEQAAVLRSAPADRREACKLAQPEYLESCLFGARQLGVAPAGLREILETARN